MLSYSIIVWTVLIGYQVSVGQEEVIGFPEEKRIRDLVTDLEERVLYYSNDFKVYPQLVFPCASALRRLIFIGADFTDIELTVHVFVPNHGAPLDSDTPLCMKYKEVPLTFRKKLTQRSTLVLLEYDASSPFPAGAILGLRHNRGVLMYQKGHNDIQTMCIPDDYDSEENFPLIAVDIDCEDSTTEFLRMADLEQIVLEEHTVSYSFNQTSVIPALSFSTPGTISSWTIAARCVHGLKGVGGPYIQIWRPTAKDGNLVLVESIEVYVEEEDCDELVVTRELDSAITVEAGDVIGVKQPENSRVFLMFERGGPTNYITNLDLEVVTSEVRSVMRLPLITPNFHSSQTPPPVTLIPSSSLSPSDSTRKNEEVRVAVIIGAILGPSVIGLILMVGVVVACLVWKKRKGTMKCQEHNSPAEQPMHNIGSNPIYNAPVNDNLAEPFYIAPTRNGDALYQSIDEAQMYEVPITTPESDSHHTYHVLEASRNPQHRGRGEDTANRNVSHTLTSPKQSEMQSEEGHDYHELESSTDDAGYELYVPCMEQRHTVYHNKGTMLYESLQKVQSSSPTSCDYFEESPSFWQPGSTTDSLYQQLYCRKFREICRHHVEATEHLGSGKFGTVKRGVWKTPGGDREVAVKMLQSNPASQDTIMFLQEAAIMGQFRHPNIVQLLGVVTLGEPIMIVLELLSSGDLSTFLNKNRAQELDKQKWPNLLLGFCQQVAAGLDYLLAKGFVHRDIAARNILLSPTHMMCKISDFGMSRDLQAENYYVTRGGDIPVKWTAPETLNYKKYSAATDIWSFGCLMYEIWGLGHKPFEGHTNMEAIELVERGYRLPPPPGCPRQVYHLVIQCWNPTASLRPSSSELLQDLTGAEESCLLQWREEDSRCHPQAHLLGAPLEAGESLYRELQLTYHFD